MRHRSQVTARVSRERFSQGPSAATVSSGQRLRRHRNRHRDAVGTCRAGAPERADGSAHAPVGLIGDHDVDGGGGPPTGCLRSGHLVQRPFSAGSTWSYNSDGYVMSCASAVPMLVNSFIRDVCVLINAGPDRYRTVPSGLIQQLGTFMNDVVM